MGQGNQWPPPSRPPPGATQVVEPGAGVQVSSIRGCIAVTRLDAAGFSPQAAAARTSEISVSCRMRIMASMVIVKGRRVRAAEAKLRRIVTETPP